MSGQWQSGLCNCCGGGAIPCLICLCGFNCVNYGMAMNKMDDSKNCVVESIKAIFCCCSCQRGEMREAYGIGGDGCNDFMCGWCCYACVGVQMHAEALKQNGEI